MNSRKVHSLHLLYTGHLVICTSKACRWEKAWKGFEEGLEKTLRALVLSVPWRAAGVASVNCLRDERR